MIKLELAVGVFVYLIVPFLVLFISWIIFENKGKEKESIEDKNHIWYCNICGFTYIDTLHIEFSRCPRCKSYIESDHRHQTSDIRK